MTRRASGSTAWRGVRRPAPSGRRPGSPGGSAAADSPARRRASCRSRPSSNGEAGDEVVAVEREGAAHPASPGADISSALATEQRHVGWDRERHGLPVAAAVAGDEGRRRRPQVRGGASAARPAAPSASGNSRRATSCRRTSRPSAPGTRSGPRPSAGGSGARASIGPEGGSAPREIGAPQGTLTLPQTVGSVLWVLRRIISRRTGEGREPIRLNDAHGLAVLVLALRWAVLRPTTRSARSSSVFAAQNAHDMLVVGSCSGTLRSFSGSRGDLGLGTGTGVGGIRTLYRGTWRLEPALSDLRVVWLPTGWPRSMCRLCLRSVRRAKLSKDTVPYEPDAHEDAGGWKVASILPIPAPAP